MLKREDVQAVIVALPISSQPEIIEKAWKAGKHVLSEVRAVLLQYDTLWYEGRSAYFS